MSSLFGQTYKHIEHIVVDGNSTDGTKDLLLQYQNFGWIHKLISEKDKNLNQAMNKGLKKASGDYILFMNTDTYFTKADYLERSVQTIKRLHVDFTHADRIIKSRQDKPDQIKKGNELEAFFRMPFRFQTLLMHKSIFETTGFFDEKYEIASDYKLVLQMLLNNKKGYYFPEVVLCSLDGGITSDRDKCIKEVSRVLYEMYGFKYGLTLLDCRSIYLQKITFSLLEKIKKNVKNKKIVGSLLYCYNQKLNIQK